MIGKGWIWPVIRRAALVMLLFGGCVSPRRSTTVGPLSYAGYRPAVGEHGPMETPEAAAPATVKAVTPATAENGAELFDPAYRGRLLRPGDPVTVSLRGPETSDVQEVIDENGTINLPNVGRVRIAGMTTSEAADTVEQAYIDAGIYLRLTVIIISQAQQRRDQFFVYGEARSQGRYELSEGMTLLQAISTAGGITDYANPARVYIRRDGRMTRYDIRPMLRGTGEDVMLQPDDTITIKARWW